MLKIRVDCIEALSFVSNLTGVSEANILSKKRNRDYSVARHFLRYYLRKNSKMTLKEVGSITSSHHATVIHSVQFVHDYSEYDTTFKLYKDCIDRRVLVKPLTSRDLVSQIIRSQKSSHAKCNLIMELITKEKNESSRANQ